MGTLLDSAMSHTYSYSVTRGTYQDAQWTLWCLQNAAAVTLRPVQHADVVNRVGPKLKRWGFPLHPTPPHTAAPLTPKHYTVTSPTLPQWRLPVGFFGVFGLGKSSAGRQP